MSFVSITPKTLFEVVPLDDAWEDFTLEVIWGHEVCLYFLMGEGRAYKEEVRKEIPLQVCIQSEHFRKECMEIEEEKQSS